ncbi:acyltransferase [Flavobacterium sp.]|uniref:acyltransferase family protein n=1 Tax=Flavobacterium sp. TaxID=239 RepID=UPI0025C65937|nr:acyltransferase [Flavobacterium sp.]
MSRQIETQHNRIFGLDLMRACAIIMVLLGHLTWILPQNFKTVNMLLSLLGFLGVEIFFVLSGFLIGRILFRAFADGDFTFDAVKLFLKRRWFRTLPNYFLILLLNIVIALWIVDYDIEGLWRYFFFLQNFTDRMPVFFPESWSLSVEEFAYLLLPFALLLAVSVFGKSNGQKLFLKTIVAVYALFIGTKIIFTFTTSLDDLAQWNIYLKGVVIYRVDAICTGVICAWLSLNKSNFWHKTRWLAAFSGVFFGLLLIFGSSFLGISVVRHHFFWNVVFLPMLSVAIASVLPILSAWRKRPYGIGKPITYVSLISYSMYLLHYGVVLQLLHGFVLERVGWQITALLYFGLTAITSALLYHNFEKPMTGLRDKH